jgi:hypothetical protein
MKNTTYIKMLLIAIPIFFISQCCIQCCIQNGGKAKTIEFKKLLPPIILANENEMYGIVLYDNRDIYLNIETTCHLARYIVVTYNIGDTLDYYKCLQLIESGNIKYF